MTRRKLIISVAAALLLLAAIATLAIPPLVRSQAVKLVKEKTGSTLARERGAAVRAFLVTTAKMDPAMVFEKSGDIAKKPDKEGVPASRVEFGLTTK